MQRLHAAMEHEFLVIKAPEANVYPNQEFRLSPRGGRLFILEDPDPKIEIASSARSR